MRPPDKEVSPPEATPEGTDTNNTTAQSNAYGAFPRCGCGARVLHHSVRVCFDCKCKAAS
jgi:hypothetical protein